jgi:hypothetical protein
LIPSCQQGVVLLVRPRAGQAEAEASATSSSSCQHQLPGSSQQPSSIQDPVTTQAPAASDRPQIARCSTPRGRSAGHPENQRRDPLGSASDLPPAYGADISRRASEARLLTLVAYR